MPTDDLRAVQIKMLNYAIYALIFILSSITAWNSISISALPNDYVRLERYKADHVVYQDTLQRIENKLDRILR